MPRDYEVSLIAYLYSARIIAALLHLRHGAVIQPRIVGVKLIIVPLPSLLCRWLFLSEAALDAPKEPPKVL